MSAPPKPPANPMAGLKPGNPMAGLKPAGGNPMAGLSAGGGNPMAGLKKTVTVDKSIPMTVDTEKPPVKPVVAAKPPTIPAKPPVSKPVPATATANKVLVPQTITEDENIDGPERCFGYLKMERKPGSARYDNFFFVLEDGELFAYTQESAPGSREGKEPPLDTMDLDRWAIALPTKVGLLLTPASNRDPQVLFEEDNIREYNKWALALNEHISWMDKIAGRDFIISADAIVSSEKVEPVAAPVAAPSTTSKLPPASEALPAKIQTEDYTDRRGIRMSVRIDPKNRYAEQTLEILRNQLIKDGKMPLEFIPLEDLKKEMSAVFEKANNGEEYDEGRLDYLLKCMDLNPEYRAEKERETAAWRKVIEPFVKESLATMRGFIPPHVFNSTLQSLTVNDNLPGELAKRIMAKKCLWLIRISTADIAKMHIAELQGRFNPEAQGLDIVELAAIFANTPQKFMNDDAKGSKEKWRLSLEECVKSFYTQNQKGTLPKLKQRNPVYKGLDAFFSQEEVYHSMHVTKSEDAFNPRASYRMIKREQKRNSITKSQAGAVKPDF